MFKHSPREMLEIAEERYGKRAAGHLYDLAVAVFVCTALGIVFTAFYAAYSYVVVPTLRNLPTTSVGQSGYFLLSISATVLLLVVSGFLVSWRFKKWQDILFRAIDNYLTPRIAELKNSLDDVRKDVIDLQIHTGTHPLMKELKFRETGLTFHFARYGVNRTNQGSVDVKDKLESHIKDNCVDILVSNETLGCHPFRGDRKTLFLTYSIGPRGQRKDLEVPESRPLVLP